MRAMGRVVVGLAFLVVAASCSRGHAVGSPAAPTGVLAPVPSPSPAVGGRLPAVVARLSFSLPGGDAYSPQATAIDETGRAVVLCYQSNQPASSSALVTIDPATGSRGELWPLPGPSLGPVAAGGGYAYAAYQDGQFHPHLAAVDLATGRLVADVPTDFVYAGDSLGIDRAGRIYLPLADRLEVRDGRSLEVVRALPYGTVPQERALAADPARDRLYLAVGERLRAYRASDLALLWEATGLSGHVHLTVDQAGRRVYARCEAFEGTQFVARLLAFDAAGGQPLPAPAAPAAGSSWQLLAADSEAGRLVFAESGSVAVRLWQTDLSGRPTGAAAVVPGWATGYAAAARRLLAPVPAENLVRIFDLASLETLADVPTGIALRYVVADPAHEMAYANDSAGRLHAINTRTYTVQASVPAGRGELALDAANGLLFVSREARGDEVAALTLSPLTVTATITGGYHVAVDPAGHRAFVGATEPLGSTAGQVQVWDTRTFRRIGAIAHGGEPAYNPLRDEVYLRDYSAYVVDGKTLAVTGELIPDIGQTPPGLRGCNGCLQVADLTVDAAQEVIAVSLELASTGGGPGTLPQPRLYSARTREPVTHTVTVLPRGCGGPAPLILPPDGGLVYEAQRFRRYVAYNATLAYPAGAADPVAWRDGLPLDLYLSGQQVGLSLQAGRALAFDTTTWQPLGWLPPYCIGEADLAGRRLYAWQGAELTILTFDGGQPLPPEPPQPVAGPLPASGVGVQEIAPSPDFAHDRTLFAIAGGQLFRSADGGAAWQLLRGGLPPKAAGIVAHLSLAISPDYAHDHTLFLGGMAGEAEGYGVWRSADGGDTWAPLWAGLDHLRVERVVASPRYGEDHTLLAYAQYEEFWRAQSGRSLFRSADGGGSWQRLAAQPNSGAAAPLPRPEELLPYPQEPVQFKVSEQGDALLRSADGGETWQPALRWTDRGRPPVAVARSPLFEGDRQVWVLFADRLCRSTDGGDTWQEATDARLRRQFEDHLTALAVAQAADGGPVAFVGDYRGAVMVVRPDELSWAPLAGQRL